METIDYKKIKDIAAKLWHTNDIRECIPPVDAASVKKYNDEPVTWCNHCNSLKIINIHSDLNDKLTCYCGECYNTDMQEGHIDEWISNSENKK